MPVTPEYKWEQTADRITVTVTMRGIPPSLIHVYGEITSQKACILLSLMQEKKSGHVFTIIIIIIIII